MADKMQVVFVKTTGHVLAACTRTADPEGKIRVEDLTGGLRVRNSKSVQLGTGMGPKVQPDEGEGTGGGAGVGSTAGGGEVLVVPTESLDVSVVEFNADVLTSPSDFAVAGEAAERLGDAGQSLTITLDENNLTFTLPSTALGEINVWAQVEKVTTQSDPEPVRRVIEGKISNPDKKVLPLTTRPGGAATPIPAGADYYVLTLVEGRRPVFVTQNLPGPVSNL